MADDGGKYNVITDKREGETGGRLEGIALHQIT
jgi:hypothetical protein